MTFQIDSRKVKFGDIFFAIPSVFGRDLLPFAEDAVKKGAESLVVNQDLFLRLPEKIRLLCTVVPNVRDALNLRSARYFVPKPKTLIVVTGTNGKTSVVDFIKQLWEMCDIKGACFGTMGIKATGILGLDNACLTTADTLTLHTNLQYLSRYGVKAVALEASSHGLDQKRLDSLIISGAIFTNFSRDHLDYHKRNLDYFLAKSRLFLELLPAKAPAIICGDGIWGKKLIKLCNKKGIRVITYGLKEANDWYLKIERINQGQKVLVFGPNCIKRDFQLSFIGSFQALNVLSAFLIVICISSVSIEKVFQVCNSLKTVKGRLEYVGTSRTGAKVFIDYSHNPEALKCALKALRFRTKGNLWLIFGCGGNRDSGKRSIMGKIADKFANYIIVTDDNVRKENPIEITNQILKGSLKAKVIHNRELAIKIGISSLNQDDSLLIAGKGHETVQIIGKNPFPFSDSKIILRILES